MELEIKLLSNLNHKNIVKYFGVKRTENEFNILLEYCIGNIDSEIKRETNIKGYFQFELIIYCLYFRIK